MRKLFTFLCAALMSVGMWAGTVTWYGWDITPGTSFSNGGVAITCSAITDEDGNISISGPGTFTSSIGNFKKIVVSADGADVGSEEEGWDGYTWEGDASSVSFSKNIKEFFNITFTFEDATVAVTGVTLNQNEAAMTVGGETLTLSATVNPEGATDKSVSWSTSNANVATVDNGVVTAVAAGTATITVTTTDGSYTATCSVTVTAPAPTDFAITANEDPQNDGVYYSTFYHGAADYTLPAGVEAYTAAISGDALNLTSVAVSGQSIPAGNAVILKSNVQNYTLAVSTATEGEYEGNVLQGTDEEKAKPANCYVLSCENNLVGFYQYGAANLNPHKAYVIYSGSGSNPAPRRMPFIFDQATGVENVQGNVQSTKVLRDGQLIIIRNGVEYNANGMMVK